MCSSGQITYKVHVIYAKIFSISINPLSLHNKHNFLSKTLFAFKLIGIFSSRYESSICLEITLNTGLFEIQYIDISFCNILTGP